MTGTVTVTGAAGATGIAASTVNAGPTIRDTGSVSLIQTSNSRDVSRGLLRHREPIRVASVCAALSASPTAAGPVCRLILKESGECHLKEEHHG